MKRISYFSCATMLISTLASNAFADGAAELAKKAQDPLANISAVQLDMSAQNNIGPDKDRSYTALVQPVYAISTESINYIPRLVLPIVGAPNVEPGNSDRKWGISDTVAQMFISPKSDSSWKWGLGPQISLKTHTDDALIGSGWGGGLAGVLVGDVGNFSLSFIANHLWGNQGDFSTTTINPMIFYNFESMPGVSLSYQGVISYDWKRDGGDRLTLPLGLQLGKMFDLGRGWGVEAALGAYSMPVRADDAADWEAKASIMIILP